MSLQSKNIKKDMDIHFFFKKILSLIKAKRHFFNVIRLSLYNDEPKIFAYSSSYITKHKNNNDVASGFSFNQERSLTKVMGEAIERYCMDHFKGENLFTSVYDLSQPKLMDPKDFSFFSEKYLKSKDFEQFRIHKDSRFRWIEAFSSLKETKVLIPAQLAIFNYKPLPREPVLQLPISSGTASGLSIKDALYRGICEIIERDSFMISYSNNLPSPKIDLNSLNDNEVNKIRKIYERYKLELNVIDLTTDLQVPSFAAITVDKTGLGPALSVGLKTDFDIKNAIIGAIEESLMVRSWIRDKFIYEDAHYKRGEVIITIEDRAHFWFSVNMIKHLDFWLNNNNLKKIDMKDFGQSYNKLERIIKLLKEKRIDIVYVDITDKNIRKYGFVVVKVVIPQLHPLYLDERHPYLGGERLYVTPVKMGLLQKPNTENQLNKVPHPFL